MNLFFLYCAPNDHASKLGWENWNEDFVQWMNSVFCYFRSSFFAGLGGAIFSTPVDVIKVCDYMYEQQKQNWLLIKDSLYTAHWYQGILEWLEWLTI